VLLPVSRALDQPAQVAPRHASYLLAPRSTFLSILILIPDVRHRDELKYIDKKSRKSPLVPSFDEVPICVL
jgi:hypothetical protein